MATRTTRGARRKSRKAPPRRFALDWSNPLTFSLLMLVVLVFGIGLLLAFNSNINDLWNARPADRTSNDPNRLNPAALFGRNGTRNNDIPRITTGDLATLQANPAAKVVVVDVREGAEWSAGHIRGSVNIPFGALEQHLDKLPQNATIVTYCACPAEETSAALARSLLQRGFTDVRALRGGYDQWVQENRPLEK